MNKLAEAIGQAKHPDELVPILELLLIQVTRLAERKGITAQDLQIIGDNLANIRSLLNELKQFEVRGGCLAGGDLAQQYLELEGKIKEIRNDLSRAVRRAA